MLDGLLLCKPFWRSVQIARIPDEEIEWLKIEISLEPLAGGEA